MGLHCFIFGSKFLDLACFSGGSGEVGRRSSAWPSPVVLNPMSSDLFSHVVVYPAYIFFLTN